MKQNIVEIPIITTKADYDNILIVIPENECNQNAKEFSNNNNLNYS
jgi:hypothetical protein